MTIEPFLLISFLSGAAIAAVLAYRLSRGRPAVAGGPEGRTAPDPWRSGAVAPLAGGLGTAILLSGGGLLWLLVGLGFLALMAVALIALSPSYDVLWTTDGLEGPSALLVPPFGPKRDFLLWRDLKRIGKDRWGNRFVEDAEGHRVCWNWLYIGDGHLLARLETVRPDLFDEDDIAMDSAA